MVRQALQERVDPAGNKPIIRTDNGPQFLSKAFGELAEELEFEHERIPPKTPNMNAYMESFHAQLEHWLLRKERFELLKKHSVRLSTSWIFITTERCTEV